VSRHYVVAILARNYETHTYPFLMLPACRSELRLSHSNFLETQTHNKDKHRANGTRIIPSSNSNIFSSPHFVVRNSKCRPTKSEEKRKNKYERERERRRRGKNVAEYSFLDFKHLQVQTRQQPSLMPCLTEG
jgi:hypothetical protein